MRFTRRSDINDNDAKLTRLYTAEPGSQAEDELPNSPSADAPAANFDLILEAAAGEQLGDSMAPYSLTITAIAETAVVPMASGPQHCTLRRADTPPQRPAETLLNAPPWSTDYGRAASPPNELEHRGRMADHDSRQDRRTHFCSAISRAC